MTVLNSMGQPLPGAGAHRRRVAAPMAILLFVLLLISGCQTTERILFTSDREGNEDIYAIDPSGENLTILTLENSDDFAPQWSPDHKRILFLSNRLGATALIVMEEDGSNQVELTKSPGVISHHRWSPDGKRVSFALTVGDTVEIHVIDADGDNDSIVNFANLWFFDQTVDIIKCILRRFLISCRN